MTSVREIRTCEALRSAWVFLSRWKDRLTIECREDMAQQAALVAWQAHDRMRDPSRLPALMRTVCRRIRYRMIVDHLRRPHVGLDDEARLRRLPHASDGDAKLEVGGEMVATAWLVGQLDQVLGYQSSLNRSMLMAYYQGFSCAELADRYQIPLSSVKVRLYRSRRRVRREFEARIGRSSRRSST